MTFTPEQFVALGRWIRAEANHQIAQRMDHHERAVHRRLQRANECEEAARLLLVGDE